MNLNLFFVYLKIAYLIKDFFRAIHHGIMKLLRPSSLNIGGMLMLLDKGDTSDYSKGYEPATTLLVKKEIKEGDTIVDLGACIGYYTLLFSKLVGKTGKVFAFEPEPKNFEILEKNVKINNLDNVVLVRKAVSDKVGKATLYTDPDYIGSHVLQNEFNEKRIPIEIETTALDEFFKDFGRRIDFVKIDIEGSEVKAINGMKNLLEKNKKMKMILEFSEIGTKDMGVIPEEYLNLIREKGFEIKEIKDDRIINLFCIRR